MSIAGPMVSSSAGLRRLLMCKALSVSSAHSPMDLSPTPSRVLTAMSNRSFLSGQTMEACQTGPPNPSSIHSYPELTVKMTLPSRYRVPNIGLAVSPANRQWFMIATSCLVFMLILVDVNRRFGLVSDLV